MKTNQKAMNKLNMMVRCCVALIVIVFLIPTDVHAQIYLDFSADTYNGGYHITCNGETNASLSVAVDGGEAPFTYLWSNSVTDNELSGIGAGVYTVTVTDAESTTASSSFTVLQPNILDVELNPSEYAGGYNTSAFQATDATIQALVGGGTPPYTYLWSTGGEEEVVEGLAAGTYTVTVTDMNECSAVASIVLSEAGQFVIVSLTSPTGPSGHNVSCQQMEEWDGSISLTVSGGVSPYQYDWSDGAMTEDRTSMKPGEYTVRITDANENEIEGSITLTAPNDISVSLTSPLYGNGYNVSCYDCFNGSINTTISGGVSPYSFSWSDSGTDEDRLNMNGGPFELVLTDNNGCEFFSEIILTVPDRDDWTMSGNEGSNPSTEFIGTQDSVDFVVRTNNQEALKVGADGNIKLSNYSGNTGMLYVDTDGNVQSGFEKVAPCNASPSLPFWGSLSSNIIYACQPNQVVIGDYSTEPGVRLRVSGNTVVENGNLYVGVKPSNVAIQSGSTSYRMIVNGKLGATEMWCSLGNPWPDYVFGDDYKKMSLNELRSFVSSNKHLPGVKSAAELASSERYSVSEMQRVQMEKIEELYLYLFELKDKIDELSDENKELKKVIQVIKQ